MKTFLDYPIKMVSFGETNYPNRLTKISRVPKQIYYRGSFGGSILKKTIAIVGTRKMTSYGKQVIDLFVSEFAAKNITTISGFMYGVDTEVHKKTIEYGGKTVSVFGNGLDYVYPAENDKLYTKILDTGGAVISEYKKDMKAQLWTYPERNRIVSGLATLGVLVIEADEESGSMITAKLAIRQKRKLWAVPGPITSKLSRGTNFLIKNGLAKMAIIPDDILGKSTRNSQKKLPEMNKLETEIYKKLLEENLSVDELSVFMNENIMEVSSALTMMGIKGIVCEVGGKFYLAKT